MGYRMLPKIRRNFLMHRLFGQAIQGPRRRGHTYRKVFGNLNENDLQLMSNQQL